MARKEDGMQFEIHPAPLKDEQGNNYVYVRPHCWTHRTMEDIDAYCAQHYAMRPGEMTRALTVFRQMSKVWLAWGDRLTTPIGTFAPKLGLRSPKTMADRVGGDDVELQSIEFQPLKEYVEEVDEMANGFRPYEYQFPADILNNKDNLEHALRQSIEANGGYSTVHTFQMFSHLSKHTARKTLDRWCEEPRPRLMRTKMGNMFIYTEV